MTQPIGDCPGCGTGLPFEQIHPGPCPDADGECPEWACPECGAALIMGTIAAAGVGPVAAPGETGRVRAA